jgi:hypothetical protein
MTDTVGKARWGTRHGGAVVAVGLRGRAHGWLTTHGDPTRHCIEQVARAACCYYLALHNKGASEQQRVKCVTRRGCCFPWEVSSSEAQRRHKARDGAAAARGLLRILSSSQRASRRIARGAQLEEQRSGHAALLPAALHACREGRGQGESRGEGPAWSASMKKKAPALAVWEGEGVGHCAGRRPEGLLHACHG